MNTWRCAITGNPSGSDTEMIGNPCACDGCRAAREIERLRAALKPFAALGLKWAPHCAPNKALPPDGSANLLDLEGLKIGAFVDAFRICEQQSSPLIRGADGGHVKDGR